ncbi:hypothetical protein NDU88_007259 [Pleurodeles waltl]|uniref:Uncharacterized protein n=1 Tax=Pleurodeles waltl TaxID=8319 RepID=A0AAV7QK49_PLEWA|nr:hypothetical protein NDU88_007259 [Pleurodeles waltl]
MYGRELECTVAAHPLFLWKKLLLLAVVGQRGGRSGQKRAGSHCAERALHGAGNNCLSAVDQRAGTSWRTVEESVASDEGLRIYIKRPHELIVQ